MENIHDILEPIWPPDYTKFFIFFLVIFLLISLFFLYNFLKKFFKNRKKISEERKNFFYSKKIFLWDLEKIKIFIEEKHWKYSEDDLENNFKKEYWEELSKILKKFISTNHYEWIFFLSFLEKKEREEIVHLETIFKKFDEQFYFYEKKWRDEFFKLISEIERLV